MPSTHFDSVRQTVDWADKAIQQGESALKLFAGHRDSFRLTREDDPKTGEKFLKLVQIHPIPDTVARFWTEALNNLRNSFDQALFAACSGIGKPVKDAHYPWATNPVDLNRRLSGSQDNKSPIPNLLWDCIRGQQPYPTADSHVGGDDLIREISKMANRKHTVGFITNLQIVNFPPMAVKSDILKVGQSLTVPGNQRWDPIKKELIIWRTNGPEPETHINPDFGINVFFNYAGILQRTPAATVLKAFLRKARSVIDEFEQVAYSSTP